MNAFERLDPLVQHHIVNTLGWRNLRPLQEASIGPVLSGQHCLLLAPTAGGKTESAMFPLLSRMCAENWPAPSILYVCPLKALINNLGERLENYTQMLGRSASVWHGDVTQSAKQHLRSDPPDVLLTTPESLEAMLISTNPAMRAHLQKFQAVVVDEIHAFAGDDRGWHLLCVLERLNEICGRELQRIGLSATVGNPDSLLQWLVADGVNERVVVQPPSENALKAEIALDFVGSLENAAIVISRLHHGEKRLVFCDSRSRVESLSSLLRAAGVRVFVSHSSLSAVERRRSEEAFARGDDCVIVATSTLELGIDVGDLDRVIQIDAPGRVASFLQRLGRTGRRAGKSRNCLFLCTSDDSLLQAAALLDLWISGYVEPIVAPLLPYHIVAQQAMALCLQKGGMGRVDLIEAIKNLPAAKSMASSDLSVILAHMLQEKLLDSDGVRCFIGNTGEESFGRRSFQEIVSVFTSPPVLTVTDGRSELGAVDQNQFVSAGAGPCKLISLGGRAWQVTNINWKERRVYVVPSEALGKTAWRGASRGLSFALCRAIRKVLVCEGQSSLWSQRAKERLHGIRQEYPFLRPDATTVVQNADGNFEWYTFSGSSINSALGEVLARTGIISDRTDEYAISFADGFNRDHFEKAMALVSAIDLLTETRTNEAVEREMKFSQCVPRDLRLKEIGARRCNMDEITLLLNEHRHWINL